MKKRPIGKETFGFQGLMPKDIPTPKATCSACHKEIEAVALRRKGQNIYRKAFGELRLNKILPGKFEANDVYHVLTGGDVDSFSFIQYMLSKQDFHYMIFSTWCMAEDDIQLMAEWLRTRKVGRIDAYVGDIFKSSYAKEYAMLAPVIERCGGRVAIFRNHSKTYAVKGYKYDFIIESSANINTNPRAENTTITIGTEGYEYLKEFYDNVTPFNRQEYKTWKPYLGEKNETKDNRKRDTE